jgi:hypothetical protein
MAREQGLPETEIEGVFIVNTDDLGRFAAAEREACAKVCDEFESDTDPDAGAVLAAAIRGRGQA